MAESYPIPPLCRSVCRKRQFMGYAYGDALPMYARFLRDSDGNDAVLYVSCQREEGHSGEHAALNVGQWADGDYRIRDQGD